MGKRRKNSDFFYTQHSLDFLAKQQGVKPVEDIKQLVADFWPENETADEIIETIKQWRTEGVIKTIQ